MKKPRIIHYLIVSLILHVTLLLAFIPLSQDNSTIHKKFIVLGKYSQKPSHLRYKQTSVPFENASMTSKGSLNKSLSKSLGGSVAQKKSPQTNKRKTVKKIKKPTPKVKKSKKTKKLLAPASKPEKETTFEEEATPQKKDKKSRKKKKIIKKKKPIVENPEKKEYEAVAEEQINPLKKELLEKIKPEEPQELPEETAPTDTADHQNTELHENEVLQFDLTGEVDPRIREYQEHIQKEVARLWNPPPGVPKGTECILCFTIDEMGTVESYEIVQRSTILIYDLSILRIAKTFAFDKCLWGKKFILEFRQ